MIVCAHGDVANYCKKHDMIIGEKWNGDFRKYNGPCRVIVTDADIQESEYYFYKGEMLARGIELVSTRYTDDALMVNYLTYASQHRKNRGGGKAAFGLIWEDGRLVENPEEVVVVARIRELQKKGYSLRQIRESDGVCHADGRKLSISTIQKILKNGG